MTKGERFILGTGLCGLAASSHGVTVFGEGFEGLSGDDFTYYVPINPNRNGEPLRKLYARAESDAWTDTGAENRAYQFWTTGLTPLRDPDPLTLSYVRRFSNVVGLVPSVSTLGLNPYFCDIAKPLMGIARSAYFVLDGPRLLSGVAAHAYPKKGYPISGIDGYHRTIHFNTRRGYRYDILVSTLPLDRIARLALPDLKRPQAALDMQILNVGMVLNDSQIEGSPIDANIHQVIFPRNGIRIFDALDIYTNVDPGFAPSIDGQNRVALGAKHIVGINEIPLSPAGYRERVFSALVELGFGGEVEVAEYHYVKGYHPLGTDQTETLEALAKVRIYQTGSVANGRELDLAYDLRNGLATGALLV